MLHHRVGVGGSWKGIWYWEMPGLSGDCPIVSGIPPLATPSTGKTAIPPTGIVSPLPLRVRSLTTLWLSSPVGEILIDMPSTLQRSHLRHLHCKWEVHDRLDDRATIVSEIGVL